MRRLFRFFCLFGLHAHSRGRALSDQGEMCSVCRRCGAPMIKGSDGRWRRGTPPMPLERSTES